MGKFLKIETSNRKRFCLNINLIVSFEEDETGYIRVWTAEDTAPLRVEMSEAEFIELLKSTGVEFYG